MPESGLRANTKQKTDNVFKRAMGGNFVAMFINQLLINTATLFDAVIVGQFYDDVCIGSVGIVYQLVFINITIGSIFAVGAQLECSVSLAKGDSGRANSILTSSLIWIAVISLCIAAFLFLFSGVAASVFGAPVSNGELHGVTADYIKGLAISVPAEFFVGFLSAVMPLDGDKRRIMLASIVMISVNIVGDLINVHVLGWGMFGIGIMTALGNYCALAVLLLHFAGKNNRFRLVRPGGLWNWLAIFFKRSFSSLFGRLMKWVYYYLMIQIVIRMTTETDLYSYSVFNNIKNIMICVCLGLGSAGFLISGTLYSENNVRGLRQASKAGLIYSVVLGAVIGGCTALFAGVILSLYGDSPAVQEAVFILRLYSIFFAVDFVKFYYSFYVRSVYKKGLSTFYNIVGEFLIPTVSALVLGGIFGAKGIWASIPIGSGLIIVITLVYSRLKNGVCKKRSDMLLLLPQSFFDGENNGLNVSPLDSREASEYAKKAQEFLEEKGYAHKAAYSVALCIEEMIAAMEELETGRGKKRINLFVRKDGERILISIRSHGRLIDPLSEKSSSNPEDFSALRLKMVYAAVDDIEYNTALGINNLIMSVRV